MSEALIAFLRARLDEDEQVARAVDDRSEPWTGQWKVDAGALRTYNDWVLAFPHDHQPLRPGLVEHWARHDPARVLADVAAKRAIVAEHAPDDPRAPDCVRCADDGLEADMGDYGTALIRGALPWPCRTVRLLATVYADHPDFDAAWAVDTPQ